MTRRQFSEREIYIHTARILLGEARLRRGAPRSHCVMLEWAGNQRRLAMAAGKQPEQQPDLFTASDVVREQVRVG